MRRAVPSDGAQRQKGFNKMTYAAQYHDDDGHDLDPRGPRLSGIIQAMGQETVPGPKYIEGAKLGDIRLCYEDGTREARPDVSIISLMFGERFIEWGPRGSGAPPIPHYRPPFDAEWRLVDGRKAYLRPNGNRVEKTLYQYALVDGFRVTFTHRSTGYQIGRDFYDELARIKVTIDSATAHMIGARYRLFSELTPPNARGERWYALRYTRLGILGEPNGPTLDEVRIARDIRNELRAEEAREKEEYVALSKVKPTPALGRAPGPAPLITTGIERQRSWADPRSPEIVDPEPAEKPAEKAVDPKLNDNLDDMPWND
jgi:hypothetical protein